MTDAKKEAKRQGQELLLELSLAMMLADGSADASEVAALKELAESTPYFSLLDTGGLIDAGVERVDELHTVLTRDAARIREYAEEPRCRRRLFEVLLRVLLADGKVDVAEVLFLKSVLETVGMTNAALIQLMPDAAEVLFTSADPMERASARNVAFDPGL